MKIVIFDSLSTLTIYSNDRIVSKFAQNLMTKLMSAGYISIFPCLKAVGESLLISNISMFANKIIYVKEEGKK